MNVRLGYEMAKKLSPDSSKIAFIEKVMSDWSDVINILFNFRGDKVAHSTSKREIDSDKLAKDQKFECIRSLICNQMVSNLLFINQFFIMEEQIYTLNGLILRASLIKIYERGKLFFLQDRLLVTDHNNNEINSLDIISLVEDIL